MNPKPILVLIVLAAFFCNSQSSLAQVDWDKIRSAEVAKEREATVEAAHTDPASLSAAEALIANPFFQAKKQEGFQFVQAHLKLSAEQIDAAKQSYEVLVVNRIEEILAHDEVAQLSQSEKYVRAYDASFKLIGELMPPELHADFATLIEGEEKLKEMLRTRSILSTVLYLDAYLSLSDEQFEDLKQVLAQRVSPNFTQKPSFVLRTSFSDLGVSAYREMDCAPVRELLRDSQVAAFDKLDQVGVATEHLAMVIGMDALDKKRFSFKVARELSQLFDLKIHQVCELTGVDADDLTELEEFAADRSEELNAKFQTAIVLGRGDFSTLNTLCTPAVFQCMKHEGWQATLTKCLNEEQTELLQAFEKGRLERIKYEVIHSIVEQFNDQLSSEGIGRLNLSEYEVMAGHLDQSIELEHAADVMDAYLQFRDVSEKEAEAALGEETWSRIGLSWLLFNPQIFKSEE